MYELELEQYQETAAAVWVVHGAWWIILQDETVLLPDMPPPWPAPCPN